MEQRDRFQAGPTSLPSSELWGLRVYDDDGRLLGTIDSIVRTLGGPTRAIVRPSRWSRRCRFVDLSRAIVRNGVVLVPGAAGSTIGARPTLFNARGKA